VLWMAREAGLFDKNGIRAEVAYIRSGSTMAQTLVSGEIQMSQMGGPALLAAGVARRRCRRNGCYVCRRGIEHDTDRDYGHGVAHGGIER